MTVVLGCGCWNVRSLLTSQLNRKQRGKGKENLALIPKPHLYSPVLVDWIPGPKDSKTSSEQHQQFGTKCLST